MSEMFSSIVQENTGELINKMIFFVVKYSFKSCRMTVNSAISISTVLYDHFLMLMSSKCHYVFSVLHDRSLSDFADG